MRKSVARGAIYMLGFPFWAFMNKSNQLVSFLGVREHVS